MPKTKKPPLPVGTPVAINIAQGMSVAQGVIAAAEYDDGWLYRIDVIGGDNCQLHRNPDGELWVCDFEVTPTGSAPIAEDPTPMPHTVEVVGDLLVVLDEDGNGCDAHGDRLDFSQLSVGQIKLALRAAYEAGRASTK
jgi:hypothetical protein